MSNTDATNKSMIELKDHKIWKDFKHITLDVDTALIFPHGCGGHFIAGYAGLKNFKGQSNEYHVSMPKIDYPWFRMDTWGTEYTNNTSRLDDMYDVVETLMVPYIKEKYSIMMGHHLPFFTSHIFNLKIQEIIYITVDKEWAIIPLALANIKNLCVESYGSKHFLIGHILHHFNQMSANNKLLFKDSLYNVMTADTIIVANEKTKHLRSGLIDDNSPYMWDFVSWAKSHRYTISPDSFKDFSYYIFGKDAIKDYNNSYNGKCAEDAHLYFNKITKVTNIDYVNLFFKNDKSLPWINTCDINNYSLQNIELLKKLRNVSNNELNSILNNALTKLENYYD